MQIRLDTSVSESLEKKLSEVSVHALRAVVENFFQSRGAQVHIKETLENFFD